MPAEFAMKLILLIPFLYFISEGLCFADASYHFEEKKIPNRILFIGNSYLFYNDGVSNHVKRMADEMFSEKAHLFYCPGICLVGRMFGSLWLYSPQPWPVPGGKVVDEKPKASMHI